MSPMSSACFPCQSSRIGQKLPWENPSDATANARLKRALWFSQAITALSSTNSRSEKRLRRAVKRSSETFEGVRVRATARRNTSCSSLFEMGTVLESREFAQLLLRDPGLSAHGRMNVNSKRAANYRRNFELDQFLKLCGNLSAGGHVFVHKLSQLEQFGIARADAGGKRDVAKPTFHAPEDQVCPKSCFVVLNPRCAAERWSRANRPIRNQLGRTDSRWEYGSDQPCYVRT